MDKRKIEGEAAAACDADVRLKEERPPPPPRVAAELDSRLPSASDFAVLSTEMTPAGAPAAAGRPAAAAPAAAAPAASAAHAPAAAASSSRPAAQDFSASCMQPPPPVHPTAAAQRDNILPQQQQQWEPLQGLAREKQQHQPWPPGGAAAPIKLLQQRTQQQQQSRAPHEHAAWQERSVEPPQQQQSAAHPTPVVRLPQHRLEGGSRSSSNSSSSSSNRNISSSNSSNSGSGGGESSSTDPRRQQEAASSMEEAVALLLRRRKMRSTLHLVSEVMQQPELLKNKRSYLRLLSVKVHCLLALKDGAGIAAALESLPAPLTAAAYWRDSADAAAAEEDFLPFSLRLALAYTPVICAAATAEALDGLFALLRWVKNKVQRLLLLLRCRRSCGTPESSSSSNKAGDSSSDSVARSSPSDLGSSCSSSGDDLKESQQQAEDALQLWLERYTRVAFLLVEALVARGYPQEAVQLLQQEAMPLRRAVNPQATHAPTLSLLGRTALRAGFLSFAEECFDYAACCCYPEHKSELELISKINYGLLAALDGKAQGARAAFISAQGYAEEIEGAAAATRLVTAAAEAVAADAIAAAAASSGHPMGGGSCSTGEQGTAAAAAARLAAYAARVSKAEAAAAMMSSSTRATDSSGTSPQQQKQQQQSKEAVDSILAVPPHPTPLAAVACNLAVANMYDKRLEEASFVLEAAFARCPEESLFTGGVRNLLTLYEFSCSRDACVSQLASLASAAAIEDPTLLSLLSTVAPTQRAATPP